MRRVVWLVTAASLLAFASLAFGQGPFPRTAPPPAQAGSPVALVDIVKVFENHGRFKQQMDSIRAEIEAFEREIQTQQESLSRQSQQLQAPTSDLQKSQLEASLARQAADLQVKASLKRNEILDREARVYYETYNEVTAEVARLANQYNISLVLRFDSTTIDPQDRGSVLKGVNRPVVVQHNLDLTPAVIARFAGNSGTPLGANTAAPIGPPERSIGTRLPFSGGYPN
jgi:Skp family chaperone for outer membrane proteins